ncbi:MAG: hypothetical protein ACOCZB_05400 [Spirochaetota bacterium]
MTRKVIEVAAMALMLLVAMGCATAQPESSDTDGEQPSASVAASETAPEAESVVESQLEEGQVVVVEGRVRRVGSDPFTELVITDADGVDWYLSDDAEAALAGLEQDRVRVRGEVRLRRMLLADGRDLGTRRELTNVTILEESDE